MLQLTVNPSDDLPLYRQIVRQITEAIAGGRLRRGDRLASHRELSEQLVIAPLTVKKAYDELEALGYIETRRGRGTFVCAALPKTARARQIGHLEEAARKLLSQAYLAGLTFPDAISLLAEADRELRGATPFQERRK